MTGLLRGGVQVSAISLNSVEGFLGSDQMRMTAVMSPARQPRLPNVPAVAESVPGFEVDLRYAMLAPRDTPKQIVAKLNADLKQALESPELRDGLPPKGFTPAYSTAEELSRIIERINLKVN